MMALQKLCWYCQSHVYMDVSTLRGDEIEIGGMEGDRDRESELREQKKREERRREKREKEREREREKKREREGGREGEREREREEERHRESENNIDNERSRLVCQKVRPKRQTKMSNQSSLLHMQTNSDKLRFRQKNRQLQKDQTRSDKFRQNQTNSDKFRQNKTNSDKFRQIQTKIQTKIQTDSEKFRQIQTKIQKNSDKFWEIQTNSDKFRPSLNLSEFVWILVWICLIFLNLSEFWSEFVWFCLNFFRLCLILSEFSDFFFFSVWIQTLRQISPILDKHLEVGMECGLSFLLKMCPLTLSFLSLLSPFFLFLSCSHPALFCLLPVLFCSLSLLQALFLIFSIISSLSLSISLSLSLPLYFCFALFFLNSVQGIICKLSFSPQSLCNFTTCSHSLQSVQMFFFSEMFVVFLGQWGGEEGQLKWETSSGFAQQVGSRVKLLLVDFLQKHPLRLTNLDIQVSKPHSI